MMEMLAIRSRRGVDMPVMSVIKSSVTLGASYTCNNFQILAPYISYIQYFTYLYSTLFRTVKT